MFRVGQKVVCIDDSPVRPDCITSMPLKLTYGKLYTVRSIQTEPELPGYGVRLEELLNPSMIWSDGTEKEWSYNYTRFQPAQEAKAENFTTNAVCPDPA